MSATLAPPMGLAARSRDEATVARTLPPHTVNGALRSDAPPSALPGPPRTPASAGCDVPPGRLPPQRLPGCSPVFGRRTVLVRHREAVWSRQVRTKHDADPPQLKGRLKLLAPERAR